MLKVKSFPITDDAGINALLVKCRLATGAHILVSDGHVCIPYEDGEPESDTLKRVSIGEQKNIIFRELDTIVHSNRVLDLQIADAKDRANVAEDAHAKALSNKDLEQKAKEATNALAQIENQKLMNDHEIVRLSRNLAMFDEQIGKLNG